MKPPSSLAIEVENLRRTYRQARRVREVILHPRRARWTKALRGVSFAVPPGEVLGLLGPNGAGKTSLVKILSTLVLPTEGQARVFGHDVVREGAAVRARIGLVLADERSFYWRLTVRQNLHFFATLDDLKRGHRATRVDELIETVGIGEWRDRPFRDLSAGIRQRTALALAMLTDPAVLLMDEPTSSLDPHAARQFRRWVRDELVERRGKTILLVTHDPTEAEELCDRVGILREGELEFIGEPAELVAAAGRHPGHRLRVTGWSEEAEGALRGLGLSDPLAEETADETTEIHLDASESSLYDVFALLARHGVRVLECDRVTPSFRDVVVERLGPLGGAG